MKKVFMILGVCLTAALVVFSCNQNTTPSKPDPKPDEGGDEPEEEASIIVIDGDFADWAAAPGVVECVLPDEAEKVSVLVMKAVADEKMVYVYFEQELEEGQDVSPFDLFIDAGGNSETGASCYLWPEACGWDYLIESEDGLLGSTTTIRDMVDMGVYQFIGPDGADGWDDPDDTDDILAPYQEKLDEISGFTSNAGVVTSGVAKVELAIERAAFGDKLGKTINIGILLYEGDSWVDNGFLPQDGEGMLAVKLP